MRIEPVSEFEQALAVIGRNLREDMDMFTKWSNAICCIAYSSTRPSGIIDSSSSQKLAYDLLIFLAGLTDRLPLEFSHEEFFKQLTKVK